MPASQTTEIRMPAAVARAVARATNEFLAIHPRAELGRFEVVVITEARACEVVFVPAADPGASARGGQTSAGREMHFWIALADGQLLRSSFAR